MLAMQSQYDCDLLPYDDHDKYPTFFKRITVTLREFLSHPFHSLRLISNAPAPSDGISYLLAITWPLHIISECFKFAVSHSIWLTNHSHLSLKENDVSTWWTLFSIILFPVGTWLGFWVATFLNHSMLWIWRALGNDLGIDQTARSNSFSISLLTVFSIPFSILFAFTPITQQFHKFSAILSILLTLAWITYSGIAYARAHRTAVWQGIGASFTLPAICLLLIAFFTKAPITKLLFP